MVELSVLFALHVDVNNLGSDEELEDHTGGNNWGHTKFHDGTLVGGKDNSEPVEWICTLLLDNTIQRDLTADQVNEEGPCGPTHFVVEGLFLLWSFNLWEVWAHWSNQVEKSHLFNLIISQNTHN